MRKSGLADSPFFPPISKPTPPEERTSEPANQRTGEPANGRTLEQVNQRTHEPANAKSVSVDRRLIRRSYNIYIDQFRALKRHAANTGVDASAIVRKLLDDYLNANR